MLSPGKWADTIRSHGSGLRQGRLNAVSSDPSRLVLSTVTAHTAGATARLVAGVRAVDPGVDTWVLSLDGTPSGADRVLTPDELPIDARELARRIGRTTLPEAAAALLPEVARLALGRTHSVLLMDPVIEVVGSLGDLDVRDDEALRVVPRLLAPLPVDDRHPSLAEAYEAGVYLPTILSATTAADEVLSWWSEETARHPESRADLLAIATTWIKTTQCLSPAHGINPSRIDPEGTDVHTIDTTGRRRGAAHLMSDLDGGRNRLADRPELVEILIERDKDLADDKPPLTATRAAATRRLYTEALRRHELLGEPEPPGGPSAEFDAWMSTPSERSDGLSRAAMTLHGIRFDLQAAFPAPDLGPANRAEFMNWLRTDGVQQEGLDPEWVPIPPMPADRALTPGVDLAGYINADLGVGEVARLLSLALEHHGTPTSIQTIGGSASNTRSVAAPDDPPSHPIEILCVNADRVAEVVKSRGRDTEMVHTIGVFFWETDLVTPEMQSGLTAVDEIWAGSRYVADCLTPWTELPVHVLPLPVVADEPEGEGYELMGVDPDRPVVLFAFDFHSVAKRKNPIGLVKAFVKAFSPDEGPVLVLKSINGHRVPDELDRLRWATRDRSDIRVIDRYCSPGQLSAMIKSASVYASLHRSEGFGITIAHAMALGTPVLCTEGSGPADFISADTATIVPGNIVEVGAGAEPYPAAGTWRDPDVEAAADGLRTLVNNTGLAGRQAEAAMTSISARDVSTTAAFLAKRLKPQPRDTRPDTPSRRRWRR